ncbi:hypothetical protein F5882DRAFT_525210 [Hyaloscypha sp. PMI_1271]|nr:hypothetical protein F5882DRAFT_525210 [Hyaloscypha sp. PMI_1271]
MSSCAQCWKERKSCEQPAGPAPNCPSCRASSSRTRVIFVPLSFARWSKDSVAFGTLIGSAIFIEDYDPAHGQALGPVLLDGEGNKLCGKTGSILRVCLCKLAKLAQAAAEQNRTLEKIIARIASLLKSLHITRLLEDPPPQLFLAACLFFAFAIVALQHLHKADIYLNRILVSGSVIGCAAAFQTTNVLMVLKSYLAWSAILALFLSVIVHWAMRLWQGPQSLNDELEIGRISIDLVGSYYRRESQGGVGQKAS